MTYKFEDIDKIVEFSSWTDKQKLDELLRIERERLRHINMMMKELHETNNQIYEHLIDREYEDLKSVVKEQIKSLQVLLDSLQDEII